MTKVLFSCRTDVKNTGFMKFLSDVFNDTLMFSSNLPFASRKKKTSNGNVILCLVPLLEANFQISRFSVEVNIPENCLVS